MANPFNFEKDFPELYEEVQAQKAKKAYIDIVSLSISITINLAIVSVLIAHDVSGLAFVATLGWTSFSSIFAVKDIVRWMWK